MLKEKYPRLYLLSEQKYMVIEECGLWDGYTWHWNLLLWRELYEWETGQAHELLEVLQQAHLNKDNVDSRNWAFDNTGVFSTKSFTDTVTKNQVLAARVWCKVAPIKVELLVWFLVLGKLNAKDRLVSLNIIDSRESKCILCNEHDENIDHLFFLCEYARMLWCDCLSKWRISWVMPTEPKSAFESWIEVKVGKSLKRDWCVCFFAICWSIWEARNRAIFEKQNFQIDKCLQVMRYRCQLWSKDWRG